MNLPALTHPSPANLRQLDAWLAEQDAIRAEWKKDVPGTM